MKRLVPLSIAIASLLFSLPALAQDNAQPSGERMAMRMVRAQAQLKTALDAESLAPGSQFRAVLDKDAHLDNGTDLRRGTVLLGRVETDDMNVSGTSKIAIRFTQAMMKDGQTIPIKATVVSAFKPGQFIDQGDDVMTPIPNTWNDGTLQVDQIGVSHDVDMHSKIASRNSAVFVSTHGKDVKLPAGSELNLAITERNPAQMNQNGDM